MEVGDLVRISGGEVIVSGLAIAIEEEQSIQTDYGYWKRVFILFPSGLIGWEYDIDLEVVK